METTKLSAREVMKKPVISTKKSASARDIAFQLVSGRFSGMPVTDEEERVIGVITEHDLLEQVREGKDLGNHSGRYYAKKSYYSRCQRPT